VNKARRVVFGLLRLSIAAFLLWVVAVDHEARVARLALAALPGFDFTDEVRSLRNQGRYGEALVIGEAGLRAGAGGELADEVKKTRDAQESWLRVAKDAGLGALTGRGDSLASLIGAIGADMLVIGDVRDLLIEGSKLALDGDADEVTLALSAAGLATTLAPEIDWLPALLKAAKRAGALTRGLGDEIIAIARRGDGAALKAVASDAQSLAKSASPAGAAAIMRHAESADDLAALARFAERSPDAGFALLVTGGEGAALAKRAVKAGPEDAARAESLLVAAAKKGRAGAALLSTKGARAMLKPHPLIGALKAVWKGSAAAFVQRLLEALDVAAWWVIALLVAWTVAEVANLLGLARATARADAR
jgi:hypothetical protein